MDRCHKANSLRLFGFGLQDSDIENSALLYPPFQGGVSLSEGRICRTPLLAKARLSRGRVKTTSRVLRDLKAGFSLWKRVTAIFVRRLVCLVAFSADPIFRRRLAEIARARLMRRGL